MGMLSSFLEKNGRRFIKRKDSDAGETGDKFIYLFFNFLYEFFIKICNDFSWV